MHTVGDGCLLCQHNSRPSTGQLTVTVEEVSQPVVTGSGGGEGVKKH